MGAITGTLTSIGDHHPIAGVQIVARGTHGQGAYGATTDAQGGFHVTGLPPGEYRVKTSSTAYIGHAEIVHVRPAENATVVLVALRSIAAVAVSAPRRLAPSRSQLYHSSQTQVSLGRNVIAAQAPLAGSEQLLAAAPGVTQASYGSTGAAKSMISLRGFKQGWGNQAGVVDNGLFGVTLNGVYLNNPQTGIWEPNEVPDLSIISGASVAYGPGEPLTRTFDSMGGTVDFYTILPSQTSTFRSSATTGSYGGQGYHLDFSDALSSHWDVLVAQGRTFTQGFRDIIGSGNAAPGSSYGTFAELQNTFRHGSLLLFGYSANGTDYRPNLIPVTPLVCSAGANCPKPGAVVTVNGFGLDGNPIDGPAYSQQTSGFYSALSQGVWQKTDTNATRLLGLDVTYNTAPNQYITNQAWDRFGDRIHVKDFNFDQANNTGRYEYNNPYSNALGDTFAYHLIHGINDFAAGFNLLYAHYQTKNAFWNNDPVQSYPSPVTTITEPSNFREDDFWMQNLAFFWQDTMHVTPRFEMIPGIRSVALNTSFVNNGLVGFPSCALPTSPCYGNNHSSEPNSTTSYHQLEPSVGFRWQLAQDFAAYANYGRAIRNPQASPGGPYERVSVQGLLPEATDDDEVGVKYYQRLLGTNLDGSERENFATLGLYQSTLQNQNIPITTGQGLKVSSASGTSRYAGLTFAFEADARRDLQFFGGYAITHAAFLNYVLPGPVSYSGLPVTNTPITSGNLGIVFEAPTGKNTIVTRLWDQYVGPQPMWNNALGMPDPAGHMIPPYDLLNGSLEFRVNPKRYPIAFSVSATNLLDRQYNVFEYITSGAYFAGGPGQSINYGTGQILADPGPPREVQFTISFGE